MKRPLTELRVSATHLVMDNLTCCKELRLQRLIGAALLLVLFVAVHGSRNPLAKSHVRNIRDVHRDKILAKRQQSNCTFLDNYPDSCTTALDDLDSDSSSEDLANALDEFCIPECVQPQVDQSNCLGDPLSATYYNNLVCGQSGNQYSLVILDEDSTIVDDISCVPLLGGPCTESCASMQEAVVDAWGCCAASYYAFLNATCGDGAGDVCDGVVDAGIVNRVRDGRCFCKSRSLLSVWRS